MHVDFICIDTLSKKCKNSTTPTVKLFFLWRENCYKLPVRAAVVDTDGIQFGNEFTTVFHIKTRRTIETILLFK